MAITVKRATGPACRQYRETRHRIVLAAQFDLHQTDPSRHLAMAQEHGRRQLARAATVHALVADEVVGQQRFDIPDVTPVDGLLQCADLLAQLLLAIADAACTEQKHEPCRQQSPDRLETA